MKLNHDMKKDGSNGRRDVMFAAAAAAVCSVAGIAVAAGPKPGTPEANSKDLSQVRVLWSVASFPFLLIKLNQM